MRQIRLWLAGATELSVRDADRRLADLRAAMHDAGIELLSHEASPALPAMPDPGTLFWQAADRPFERAQALAAGAGDVIGPWMHPAEALARALRFAHTEESGFVGPTHIFLGELEIDLVAREARRQGRQLGLLRREYELLCYLARRPGEAHSRADLLRGVWRLSIDPGTNVVEVHISRLRAKLDRGFERPMLCTVRGEGYALIAA